MMIASIFIEAWDLYTISLLLIFLTTQFHPSALLLGLASAGTQAGAIVGALAGGWLMDRFGRRLMFLATMVMFIVFAVAQAFPPSMEVLAVIRLLLDRVVGGGAGILDVWLLSADPVRPPRRLWHSHHQRADSRHLLARLCQRWLARSSCGVSGSGG
jgi:MFS family permease